MDIKLLLTVFTVIFLADLGDKTQLATLLFAADKDVRKLTVFLGASLAPVVAAGIGVLAGASSPVCQRGISELHRENRIHRFGIWTLLRA